MCVFDWRAKTIAVRAPFCVACKNAVLQPSLENFQIRQTMCDTLFVRFSNMATNQATVNPPVPVTILRLHVVNIMRYVIRIKKHLHNQIESQGIWIVTPLKIHILWGAFCLSLMRWRTPNSKDWDPMCSKRFKSHIFIINGGKISLTL